MEKGVDNKAGTNVEPSETRSRKINIIKMVSPLIGFAFYLLYVIFVSTKPFLTKWLEGCFAFFLALVLSNIIRSRLMSAPPPDSYSSR